jgi:hypothetical protein
MVFERIAENKIREAMPQIARLERELSEAPVAHAPAIRRALTDRRTQLAVVLEHARRA